MSCLNSLSAMSVCLTRFRFAFSRLVTAIRSSDTTIGGRSALNRAFDRTVEEELDGIDDPLNNGIKRKGGPGRVSTSNPVRTKMRLLTSATWVCSALERKLNRQERSKPSSARRISTTL